MNYNSIKQTSKKIKQLLANNRLKEAIKDLIDFVDLLDDKDIRNTVILKNANYLNLKNKEIKGISSSIESERNKLINSLLSIIDEIEEELIDKLSEEQLLTLSLEDKKRFKYSDWVPLELTNSDLNLSTNQLFFLEKYNRQVHLWNLDEAEIEKEKETYFEWLKGKRKFDHNEIIEGSWIKITRNGEGSVLSLLDDNSILEYSIHDPLKKWGGTWKLHEGILILEIQFEHWQYKQIVIANREVMNHSGHEVVINSRDQSLHYFQMLLIKNRNDYW